MTSSSQAWDPCEHLTSKCGNSNYALIILNTCFQIHKGFLLDLWQRAKVRITVDGGTEKWLNWLQLQNIDCDTISSPDLVTGDMDSVSKDVLKYFQNRGKTRIVSTPDQNETDFTKSLRELNRFCLNADVQVDTVYVIADTCGRLDQIMANINTLYKACEILKDARIFQLANDSLTWLLQEGSHTINIPLILRQHSEWCALIPFKRCRITTSGLKWNLANLDCEFGGMVSTSNTYDEVSSEVTIEVNGEVLWTMGILPLLKNQY